MGEGDLGEEVWLAHCLTGFHDREGSKKAVVVLKQLFKCCCHMRQGKEYEEDRWFSVSLVLMAIERKRLGLSQMVVEGNYFCRVF